MSGQPKVSALGCHSPSLLERIFIPRRRNSQLLQHFIIGDEGKFGALEADWNDLFCRAEVQTPFLRYSWSRLCWERQRTIPGTRLFVIVVRDNDQPVLIAPLVAKRSGFWRRDLWFLDSLTPQYNDLLVASDGAPRYVSYLWQVLSTRPRLRRFVAMWVRDDSRLAPYLRTTAYKEGSHEAPFIDFTGFESWEHYVRCLSKNLSNDHRRQLKRLERGHVIFAKSGEQNDTASITWLFARKREWLERKNTTHRWLSEPETEKLFAAVANEGIESGRIWLTTLLDDCGRTIASCFCFREASILYLSKLAYDPAWSSYSPARTLLLLTIERAFREGLRKFDLMIGGENYKKRLATGAAIVRNRRADLSLRVERGSK
jgi:CelD/BcsL family acetyltransferase involved in cellulose biosynthesis